MTMNDVIVGSRWIICKQVSGYYSCIHSLETGECRWRLVVDYRQGYYIVYNRRDNFVSVCTSCVRVYGLAMYDPTFCMHL